MTQYYKPPEALERYDTTSGNSTSSTQKSSDSPTPSDYSWYQGQQSGQPAPNWEGTYAPTTGTMIEATSAPSASSTYSSASGGANLPSDTIFAKVQYYSMTGEDYSHEPEWIQKELRKQVVDISDNVSAEDKEKITEFEENYHQPDSDLNIETVYEEFNEPYEEARSNLSTDSIADKLGKTYKTPSSIEEAKGIADQIYMDTLEYHYALATKEGDTENRIKLRDAIERGAMDFANPQVDNKFIFGDTGNAAIIEAARFQALSMKDYLVQNDMPLYQDVSHERIQHDKVYINTGTALQWFENEKEEGGGGNLLSFASGLGHSYFSSAGGMTNELGGYTLYQLAPPPKQSQFEKNLAPIVNIVSAVASVAFPQFAPIINGVNTLVQGGDFEDALIAGGKAYLLNNVTEATTAEINDAVSDFYGQLGVDISTLPEGVQNVIFDTTTAVFRGDSGKDEFIKSATGEALSAVDFDINSPDWSLFDSDKLWDGLTAAFEAAGDIIEPVVEPIGDLIEGAVDLTADTFEPLVDIADEALDTFGETVVDPALQTGSDALSTVEDVILEGGRTIDDTVLQPVKEGAEQVVDIAQEGIDTLQEAGREFDDTFIDPIDDAIDTFGSEVVDPMLQTGSDVLSDFEDVLKDGGRLLDDLIDYDSLLPSLEVQEQPIAKKRTQVESLFDNELFKFNTEIKVNEEEMLTPLMNLRRYG